MLFKIVDLTLDHMYTIIFKKRIYNFYVVYEVFPVINVNMFLEMTYKGRIAKPTLYRRSLEITTLFDLQSRYKNYLLYNSTELTPFPRYRIPSIDTHLFQVYVHVICSRYFTS